MKLRLLGGLMLMALAASEPAAHAQQFIFAYTGNLVTFTVPIKGTYQIIAFGAQGGESIAGQSPGAGGRGAEIGGEFSLTAGESLQIAVGGAGMAGSVTFTGGGGGGGSFVVSPGNTPLVIASGGGGGGTSTVAVSPADPASPARTAGAWAVAPAAVAASGGAPLPSAAPPAAVAS